MKNKTAHKKKLKNAKTSKTYKPFRGLIFIIILAVFIFLSDNKIFPFLNLERNSDVSSGSFNSGITSISDNSGITSISDNSKISGISELSTPGLSSGFSATVSQEPSPNPTMYINVGTANLRSENNTDSTVIKQLSFRNKVERIQILGNWSKVVTADDITGYVYSEFLSSVLPQVKPTSPPPRSLTKWPSVSTLLNSFYNADLKKYLGRDYDTAALPLKGITVIIDPGHGGRDPGAVEHFGDNYVYEKTINLQVSIKIGDILKRYGADVIYTRSTDIYRGLYYRVALINKTVLEKHKSVLLAQSGRTDEISETKLLIGKMDYVINKNTDDIDKGGLGVFLGFGIHKDLRTIMDISREHQDIILLSVHCNRILNSSTTKGVEIFYGTGNAIYLDEKKFLPEEPKSNPLNPSYMFYNEAERKKLATAIRDSVRERTPVLTNRGGYGSLYARNFCMIREQNLTSSLIELGYISNTSDRNYLMSSDGQSDMAESITYAVFRYFCRAS